MKILVGNDNYTDYVFYPATRQITFSGFDNLKLENILLITNVTTNKMIYNFADPSVGGSLINFTLTLDYDTTTMSSSDRLQIFVESDDNSQEMLDLLRRLLKQLEPIATQDSQQRQRIVVDNIGTGTISTVSTVSNVTNMNYWGQSAFDIRYNMINWDRQAYNSGIRDKLVW